MNSFSEVASLKSLAVPAALLCLVFAPGACSSVEPPGPNSIIIASALTPTASETIVEAPTEPPTPTQPRLTPVPPSTAESGGSCPERPSELPAGSIAFGAFQTIGEHHIFLYDLEREEIRQIT